MRSVRVLSTVSAIALTAGVSMSAQAFDSPNLLIDLFSPTLSVTGGSAAATATNSMTNAGGSITASNSNVDIGFPTVGTNDIGGSANSVLVDSNIIFAGGVGPATPVIGNDSVTEVDVAAVTGTSPDNAGIAATQQLNDGTEIAASVDDGQIRIDVDNAGPDDSLTLTSNTIVASTVANGATNSVGADIPGNALVTGVIPLGYSSTEEGHVTFDSTGAPPFEAAASMLAGNGQLNNDITVSSTVVDSRIGLLADDQDIEGVPILIDGNTIEAALAGNDANNIVQVESGGAVDLVGSVAVANLQVNVGDDTYDASVTDSYIEAGQSVGGPLPIDDLIDSSLNFTNNTITAGSVGNTAFNTIEFVGAVGQVGPTTETQNNATSFAGGIALDVEADMVIANGQLNDVDVTATVDRGIQRVRTLGLDGSDVIFENNETTANAGQNEVVNQLNIDAATTFDSSVGINSLQYGTGLTTATNIAVMDVRVSGNGSNLIDASTVEVDDNTLATDAYGNRATNIPSITGTNVVGDGTVDANIDSDRPNLEGSVTADLSVLSAQVLDGESGGGVVGEQFSNITVDFVLDTSAPFDATAISNSLLSVSGNDSTVDVYGNHSLATGMTVDSTNINATVGVLNSQTVEDGAILTALLDDGPANSDLLDVDVFGNSAPFTADLYTFEESKLLVEGNEFSAELYGNLSEANLLQITGTTINDDEGATALPNALVDRTLGAPGIPTTTTTAGFSLVNDQSVEDLGEVTVAVNPDAPGSENLIDIAFSPTGNGQVNILDSEISMSRNTGIASAVINDATSGVIVDADAGLNASTSLVNSQTVAAENSSQSLTVDVLLGGGYELYLENVGDITTTNVDANENSLLASAALNNAVNSVSVSATGMVITDVTGAGDASAARLGDNSETNSEVSLVNDQYFNALGDGGVEVGFNGRGVNVDIGVGEGSGDLTQSSVNANANTITVQTSGNTANNQIDLTVTSIDLDAGEVGGTTRRGPVATIASNQRGVLPIEGSLQGFTSVIERVGPSFVNPGVNVLLDGDGDAGVQNIFESDIVANNNEIAALSVVNDVTNTLVVSGTSFSHGDANDPRAELFTVAGDDLEFFNSAFGIGSRQQNAFNVTTVVNDADIDVSVDVDSITQSAIAADANSVVASSAGNRSVNEGGVDFVSNEGQMFVGNVQLSTPEIIVDPQFPDVVEQTTISSEITLVDINADADQGDTVLSGSAVSTSENLLLANSIANSTQQRLDVAGTNLFSSFDGTPEVSSDSDIDGLNTVTADYAILNSQGSSDLETTQGDIVTAMVTQSTIEFEVNTVLDGGLRADENSVFAQGTLDAATNWITFNADANLGVAADDIDSPSSAIFSRQARQEDSSVFALVDGVQIGSVGSIDDISSDGAVGISIDNNAIVARSQVGVAQNLITPTIGDDGQYELTAGASIYGKDIVPSATLSLDAAPEVLNADHTILNQQINLGADSTAIVGGDFGFQIGANINSDAVNDAVTVNGNVIEALARGFTSLNLVVLRAGASSDVTAIVANEQLTGGSLVTASIIGAGAGSDGIGVAFDGGMDNSAASVSNNGVFATARTNTSTNVIDTFAEASLQESFGVTVDLDPSGVTPISVTGADYAILNQQYAVEGATSASITGLGIGIGVDGPLDSSALNVNGNNVIAFAVSNDASNSIIVNAGTTNTRPSAAIASVQLNGGQTTIATVSNVSVGIGGVGGSSSSASSVSGNSVGATAVGNRAFSSIGQ
ncbi:MAG: beta strand repeat-containing protein [Alphaproteobacteria bacterium]